MLSTSIIYVVYEKCKFEVEVENYKFNEANLTSRQLAYNHTWSCDVKFVALYKIGMITDVYFSALLMLMTA